MRSLLFRWGEKIIRSSWILPIAYLLQFFAWIRNFLYDLKVFKIEQVHVPVLSVGNISLGGSGKTPLVIFLAKHFAKRKVAILSRGYGGGDEEKVILQNCPNVKIYSDPDRIRAAKKAEEDRADLIILDDGFQHRRLQRDWDLVLLDPTAILLREGKGRLRKADLLVSFFENCSSVQFVLKPKEMNFLGESVAIFCGIANPIRFEKMIVKLGANVVAKLFLGDHEPPNVEKLKSFFYKSQAKYLLCTEKDWVKLPPIDLPIHCIKVDAVLVRGESLWQAFLAKIDERIDNNPNYEERKFNNLLTKTRGEHPECNGCPMV